MQISIQEWEYFWERLYLIYLTLRYTAESERILTLVVILPRRYMNVKQSECVCSIVVFYLVMAFIIVEYDVEYQIGFGNVGY